MCTISYLNNNQQKILTFNRDEHISKPASSPFTSFTFNGTKLIAPLEPIHKGTWFVAKPSGQFAVLFNGAKNRHIPNPPYLKSRGIVLLEIFSSKNVKKTWKKSDFQQIEPFTIIFFDSHKLFKYQWNGEKKTTRELDPNQNHIWSSSTLYSVYNQNKRKEFFQEFSQNQHPNMPLELLKMHQSHFSAHQKLGAIFEKNKQIHTKSISQLIIENKEIHLKHLDLINNQFSTLKLLIQ